MTAVNPLRGEAVLQVGDTALKLVMDVNAFCFAQEALKLKPLEMVGAFSADPDDLLLLRGLLWAALQKHNPCHLLEAGEIITDAGSPATRAAITNMMVAAFGLEEKSETEGKKGENPPKKTHGNGRGSTSDTAKPAATA